MPAPVSPSFVLRAFSSSSSIRSASASASAEIEAVAAAPTVAETAAAETVLSRDDARSSASSYLSQYAGESAASIVYSKLVENDVTVVNGYSGGAVLPLLDQFHGEHPRHGIDATTGQQRKIRWITNSNESSAGHIGEGFAKSAPSWKDGRMQAGVIVATSGPGVTNLITPITDAMCDGVPLVVLCGQAATFAPEAAFQSCPAVDLTRPVTKWSYQITSAAEVPFVMDYAFYVARNGRPGPVFIDLPKDLQNQVITDDLIADFAAGLGDVSADAAAYGYGSAPPTASKTAHFDAPFIGLSTHTRSDGRGHYAIHLGEADEGLAFDVVDAPDGAAGTKALRPTLSARQGGDEAYELDTHPANTISETKIETDGSTTTRVGKLMPGAGNNADAGDTVLADMLDLIRQARKPVIVAGQGVNDAPAELLAFAEALQIPVTTTLHAMGVFDERHPLALNMLGMHGHATPNFMVQECDLLINIGSRFDDRITGALGSFLPEARRAAVEGRGGVIHVDIRKSEHAKQVEPNFFIHSTGVDFLRAINAELGIGGDNPAAKPATTTRSWLKYKAELEKEYPVPVPEYRPETIKVQGADGSEHEEIRTKMSAQYVVKKMNEVILAADRMDDCFFSTGVGIHQMVTAQHITWTKPRQMLSSGSLGTMGVCLGYTIGSKLANPQAICIGIDGDGSFNMTFTELKTVAEQGIPIKMIILDNESQMMVEYWQRLFHGERYLAVRNTNPDYVALADAFKIKSVYCDHAEDLEAKLREFLFEDPDQPVLFHCRIERTPCMPMVAPGKALDDMIHRDEAFDVDPSAAPS
mmetsp:Transcript_30902/g.90327  ORF Transcript_30902/g.90327 Transcript_30902/m.90327 type:complete len:812 (-) Transcript_30902:129-2564(-)